MQRKYRFLRVVKYQYILYGAVLLHCATQKKTAGKKLQTITSKQRL